MLNWLISLFRSPIRRMVMAGVNKAIDEAEAAFEADKERLEEEHKKAVIASLEAHAKSVVQKLLGN